MKQFWSEWIFIFLFLFEKEIQNYFYKNLCFKYLAACTVDFQRVDIRRKSVKFSIPDKKLDLH